MKTQWFVIGLGRLSHKNKVIKFSFIPPSYAKKLIGITVFSPEVAYKVPFNEVINLSLMVNNEAQVVLCRSFSLGYCIENENNSSRIMTALITPIFKGERINGYIEMIDTMREESIEIKLHLKYEIE